MKLGIVSRQVAVDVDCVQMSEFVHERLCGISVWARIDRDVNRPGFPGEIRLRKCGLLGRHCTAIVFRAGPAEHVHLPDSTVWVRLEARMGSVNHSTKRHLPPTRPVPNTPQALNWESTQTGLPVVLEDSGKCSPAARRSSDSALGRCRSEQLEDRRGDRRTRFA